MSCVLRRFIEGIDYSRRMDMSIGILDRVVGVS